MSLLEDKIKTKSKKCPYCGSEMEFGYITGGNPTYWYDSMKLRPKVTHRLSGFIPPSNYLPSLKCNNCGIVIAQYE
jgi:ribosomal protein S27AE